MESIQKTKKNKAQAIVVVFIYISIVSLTAIYMMVYASNLHRMVIREINHSKAFYAGEAGLIQAWIELSGAGDGAVNLEFPPIPPGIDVTTSATNLGDGYYRIDSTVSDWRR